MLLINLFHRLGVSDMVQTFPLKTTPLILPRIKIPYLSARAQQMLRKVLDLRANNSIRLKILAAWVRFAGMFYASQHYAERM